MPKPFGFSMVLGNLMVISWYTCSIVHVPIFYLVQVHPYMEHLGVGFLLYSLTNIRMALFSCFF